MLGIILQTFLFCVSQFIYKMGDRMKQNYLLLQNIIKNIVQQNIRYNEYCSYYKVQAMIMLIIVIRQIIMMGNSMIFLILLPILSQSAPPCPPSCLTCSSQTQCLTCSQQYYPEISSPSSPTPNSLQCLPCSEFCLSCTGPANCTSCIGSYVVVNGLCTQCQIENADKCKSVVSAQKCKIGYYVEDNYCRSCLLNCGDCASYADCRACMAGFYLNSTVLTCNFCPSTCLTCDQYNSTRCLTCRDGYALSGTNTCDFVTCSIANCLYCSTTTVCKQCNTGYYWSLAQSLCVQGAGILCVSGAQGPYPNQCNRDCGQFGYIAQQNSTALWCLPYKNISLNGSTYSQYYIYAYTNLVQFQSLFSSTTSLLSSSPQPSFPVSASQSLSLALPPFYKLTLVVKYASQSPISLSLTSATESAPQSEQLALPASPSPSSIVLSTVYLHSNNVQIQFNFNNGSSGGLGIVELLIRTRNCDKSCERCLNLQLCEICVGKYQSAYKCVDNCTIYYHFVPNRTCLTSCPDLYYPVNLGANQKFCQPCVLPCKKCVNQTMCLSCVTGKFLYNYTCVLACPNTYYNDTSGICAPCISPCLLCINQTTCISCKQGYWSSVLNSCTVMCPNGYYGNDTTKTCQLCQSPCQTCRNTSSKCLTCIASLYYKDFQCLTQCPQRYYPIVSNLTCSACILPCFTCSSSSICLSCSYNFLYNGQCIASCLDGYFENLGTKSCLACSSECKTCQMFGECTSCKPGKCYLEGLCVTACPSAVYYSSVTNQGTANQECKCLGCPYPCKECLPSSLCTSCLQGYFYNVTNQCVNACPIGYFPNNSTFVCTLCRQKYTNNCLQCNTTSCTRCANNYLLHNGLCLTQCPLQHYKSSQTCQKCVAPCFNCTSFSQCSSCISPYFFNNGSCIIQCPFGSFPTPPSCTQCSSPCQTCSSPLICQSCQSPFFLTPSSTCTPNCSSLTPVFTFYPQPITSTCSKCMFPCLTCESQSKCLSCQIGFLSNGKCQNCPYGTYPDVNGQVCSSCALHCQSCYGIDYCVRCQTGYYLYRYGCVADPAVCVDNGYYAIGRVCDPCQMPCGKCNGTATNCLSCVTGYIFMLPNLCITQCPKGTYRNGSECLQCHPYCSTCSGSETYCFSCKASYLFVSSSMQCVTTCPNRTFVVGSSCQLCQYPCLQCIAQSQCISCISGTLVNQSCWSSCPSGYYSDVNLTCQMCQSPCSQCEASATTCKQCINGYYLYHNQCLAVCPALYFGQTQAHQCLECLGLCLQCSSHVNCTTCNDTFSFYYNTAKNYGQCVSQCPITFYNTSINSRSQCQPCLPQCLTCTDPSSCLLCLGNKPQHLGQCIPECPPQMYSSMGVCTQCSDPCLNCSDTFTCTACKNDSFLLVGSAECVVGQICPQGFYRIPGTRDCNSTCPIGMYYRNDRVCGTSCDVEEFRGADWKCYGHCPYGFKADKLFQCAKCEEEQCQLGLFYDINVAIVRDQLTLILFIWYLSLQLDLILTSTSNQQCRRLSADFQLPYPKPQLYPSSSFPQTLLTLIFQSSQLTFSNPLQRPSKTFLLPGYDMYPSTPSLSLMGYLLLACSLAGLVKNPYMTDFGQIVYLLALVDLHYPYMLGSAVESGRIAHLHGFMGIQQKHAVGNGKFQYITDLGLLSNSVINLGIVGIGLFLFLIAFIIYQILKKLTNYNKIQQDPTKLQQQEPNPNPNSQQIHPKLQIQPQNPSSSSTSLSIFQFLHKNFIQDFKMSFLNRLIYFNYLPISIFTFTQLSSLYFSTQSLSDLLSSIISIPILALLIIYPLFLHFSTNKPKYSFLLLRKLILSLALTLSIQSPTYMIGVMLIMSTISAILISSYSIEKWHIQTKFNSGMEIGQAAIMVIFAIFGILGEGSHTLGRIGLAWAVVFGIGVVAIGYIGFAIFGALLWGIKRWIGIDYVEKWNQQAKVKEQSSNDSQTNTIKSTKKQAPQQLQSAQKTLTLQKPLSSKIQVKNDPVSNSQQKYRIKSSSKISNNNQLFWTYNQNDSVNDHQQEENRAPEMLIRCVNQFSDYDEKQGKGPPQDNSEIREKAV